MSWAILSYAAAAAAYGLLTLILLASREPARQGQRVLVTVIGTTAWGAVTAVVLALPEGAHQRWTPTIDALRTSLWIGCLLPAIPGKATWRNTKGWIAATAVLFVGLALLMSLTRETGRAHFPLLGLSLIACLIMEQILRNATDDQRRVLNWLLWAIAAILIYDTVVFSHAALFGGVDFALWAPRGVLAALAVPLFLLAAKRHPDWEQTLFVSREVVFYTATFAAVGLYLIAMLAGAFIVQRQGGEWSTGVQLAYLAATVGVLPFVLSSSRLKANLRVFISKHFFRNRYDYREEWLRLIRTLSGSDQQLPLEQRCIKALCDIVGSDGGQMWIDREGGSRYEPFAAWQEPFPTTEFAADSAMVQFLRRREWVIDSREYRRDPELYENAFEGPEDLPDDSLIVPLIHRTGMLGFMRLACPASVRQLNYEDHDLLKTAGRQVAAFIAHDLANERLAEAQQFEAYRKLSAFVMHDLKNLLAQQALLVSNAKKFQHRPEFLDDVVLTVDSGVQRMRKLLQLLQHGAPTTQPQRVDVTKLILRAVSQCSDAGGGRCTFEMGAPRWVLAHPDQLVSVLTHLIENAQQASGPDGVVTVSLKDDGSGRAVLIEVRDNGPGMSEEFVRRRLFKPFATTKGAAGMGIGAYQAREIIRGLGGDISVKSEVGKGTVVTVSLPTEPVTDETPLTSSAGQ